MTSRLIISVRLGPHSRWQCRHARLHLYPTFTCIVVIGTFVTRSHSGTTSMKGVNSFITSSTVFSAMFSLSLWNVVAPAAKQSAAGKVASRV